MKKGIIILITVLMMVFVANYYYSNFSLSSTSTFSREGISLNENYYLGYGLNWSGLLRPKLVDVSLRNSDGLMIDQNNDEVEIVPYIDMEKHTGSLDEAGYKDNLSKGIIDYVSITDADISQNNLLVLKINLKDENYINSVYSMVLSYRIFGVPKEQTIGFDGFLD